MNSSSDDPTPSENAAAAPLPAETPAAYDARHPDPITGEPGAHPVGVGVGAIGAGIAGAAIGAIIGPIGVLVGAAIGAVTGGLAGKEVAAADDAPSVASEADRPVDVPAETVLPAAGMGGLYAGGIPAAALAGLPLMGAPASTLETSAEEEAAETGAMGGPVTGVGVFHDHLTATTLRETEEENRLTGEDAPSLDSASAVESWPVAETNTGAEEAVRTGAYFRYLDRQTTGQPGDELADWLDAERDTL